MVMSRASGYPKNKVTQTGYNSVERVVTAADVAAQSFNCSNASLCLTMSACLSENILE
jgi:hypothetical protein